MGTFADGIGDWVKSTNLKMSMIVRKDDGSTLCGVTLMRRYAESGDWLASNAQSVGLDVSSRCIMESDAAICRNGNIMVVSRGNNTETTPGRKWLTVSTDGGKTWSSQSSGVKGALRRVALADAKTANRRPLHGAAMSPKMAAGSSPAR